MAPWRMVLSGQGGHDCLDACGRGGSGTVVGDQLVLEEQ